MKDVEFGELFLLRVAILGLEMTKSKIMTKFDHKIPISQARIGNRKNPLPR
jgi:hypothetical protein